MNSPISETVYHRYIKLLLQGNRSECLSIARSLLSPDFSIFDIYEQLFKPSLYDIGDLWAKNMITVADEHIATAITESLIAQLQPGRAENSRRQQRVLISCVAADLHQIGAKMVANLFEHCGWDTFYLGANMPVTDLLDAINRIQPEIICLSLGLIEHFKPLAVIIHEIQLSHPQIPVVVGGLAFLNTGPDVHGLDRFQNVHILQSMTQLEHFISGFNSRLFEK